MPRQVVDLPRRLKGSANNPLHVIQVVRGIFGFASTDVKLLKDPRCDVSSREALVAGVAVSQLLVTPPSGKGSSELGKNGQEDDVSPHDKLLRSGCDPILRSTQTCEARSQTMELQQGLVAMPGLGEIGPGRGGGRFVAGRDLSLHQPPQHPAAPRRRVERLREHVDRLL